MSTAPGKLLVVEDDPDIAHAVTTYGKHRGFLVLHAANGRRAVEIGTLERPDVILLDIAIPELDGRDVYLRLEEAGILEQAVVIFATARDSQVDRISGLEMGADDYETKPFHLDMLFRKIEMLLTKKRDAGR
jgi:two-component system, OmpR family, response regulator ResD